MKYQARLTWGSEHIEKKLRTLPDLHDTADEAAAALREAKRVLQADPGNGWITVWPDGMPGSKLRCARGTAPPRNKGVRKRKPAEVSPDDYGPLPTTTVGRVPVRPGVSPAFWHGRPRAPARAPQLKALWRARGEWCDLPRVRA